MKNGGKIISLRYFVGYCGLNVGLCLIRVVTLILCQILKLARCRFEWV